MDVSELTKFPCRCGARLKAPAAAVGKRVKCPKCGAVNTVPATARQEEPAGGLDINAALEALARQEQSAAAVEQPATSRGIRCANCGAVLSAEARLCTQCGYDIKTGRKLKAASAKQAAAASAVRQVASGAGRFLLGMVFCAGGAAIGAILWCVVAVATGYQLGFIAWILGGLAGLGMRLGYGNENARAGAVATLIAIGGIFLAKILVFVFLVAVIAAKVAASTPTTELDEPREMLIKLQSSKELMEKDITRPAELGRIAAEIRASVRAKVTEMSDDEVRAQLKKFGVIVPGPEPVEEELDGRVVRLAEHHAKLRADREGVGYGDPRRIEYRREELNRFKAMNAEELAAAKAELEYWEDGGKWREPGYARDYLTYYLIDKALATDETYQDVSRTDLHGPLWNGLYFSARAEVERIPAEEQREKAKELDKFQRVQGSRSAVAFHRAMLRTLEEGLDYPAEKAPDELYNEELAKLKDMSEDDLFAEARRVEAWNDGDKWNDERFVRNRLIHGLCTVERDERDAQQEGEGGAGGGSAGDQQQWASLRAAAVAKVDPMTHEERRAELERVQAQEKRLAEARMARQQPDEPRAESEEEAVGAVSAFFAATFSIFDLIFFFLGAVTAFRIASGGM